MKTTSLMYALSLLIILISMVLIVQFPESGRMSLIAGVLFVPGLGLNLAAFLSRNNSKSMVKEIK